ncbi:hypothetical protein ACFQ6O_34520 [Streptomyces sp. NPDC056441]|uniref:hypothetical protein n=1 Tax=Streptomyces sp. NPDC056441 TaxID=3345817 RepID=UPI0036C71BBB
MTINLFKKRRDEPPADETQPVAPDQGQEAGEKQEPTTEETELRVALRELEGAVRELGSRLGRGSIWLCQHGGRGVAAWCNVGRRDDLEGLPAQYGVWARGAVLLACTYGAWRGVTAAPWLLAPAAGIWAITSLSVKAPAEAEEETGEEGEAAPAAEGGASTEEPEAVETVVPPVEEAPLPSHQDLHKSLSEVGTPHAHIAVLAEDLNTTAERVRALLDRLAVPVEAVRMRGRGSSTGVRADKFPAPPPGTPSEGVVVAGQPANNDNNNAPGMVRREGLVIAYTDDKTNPVRTHVHVQTDT